MDIFQIVVLSIGTLLAVAYLATAALFLVAVIALTFKPEWRAIHTETTVFIAALNCAVVGGTVMALVQFILATVFPAAVEDTLHWRAIHAADGLINAIVMIGGSFHAAGILIHVRHALEGRERTRGLIALVQLVLFCAGAIAVAAMVALPAVIGAVQDEDGPRFSAYVGDGASVILSAAFSVAGAVLSFITLRMGLPGKKSLVLSMTLVLSTFLYSVLRAMIIAAEAMFTYWLVEHLNLDSLVQQTGHATAFFLDKGVRLLYLLLHAIIMSHPINSRLVGVGGVE